MTIRKQCFVALLIGISSFWNSPLIAADQTETITEDECAHLQDADIIWDLTVYRWLCCIPKNEQEYENCVPITDMKPPPKTSLKPFPQETSKTIKHQNESQ